MVLSSYVRTRGDGSIVLLLCWQFEKISTGEELNKIKDQHKPGDILKLEVYKYATGRTETIQVTLAEQIPG